MRLDEAICEAFHDNKKTKPVFPLHVQTCRDQRHAKSCKLPSIFQIKMSNLKNYGDTVLPVSCSDMHAVFKHEGTSEQPMKVELQGKLLTKVHSHHRQWTILNNCVMHS